MAVFRFEIYVEIDKLGNMLLEEHSGRDENWCGFVFRTGYGW